MPQANDSQVGGTHYASSYQVWDFCIEYRIDYLRGNAIKYLIRWPKKGGLQDVLKAEHYILKLLEVVRRDVSYLHTTRIHVENGILKLVKEYQLSEDSQTYAILHHLGCAVTVEHVAWSANQIRLLVNSLEHTA